MRCLVISDIHANLPALQAVLSDVAARAQAYDIVWCLGDVVGYGAEPNECIDLLRTLPHICLAGNHDWAVIGKLDLHTFHEQAAFVVEWTQANLTPENLCFLKARPEQLPHEDYLLVHASPREPIWEYITDINVAEDNFDSMTAPFCLVGHTHVPVVFVKDGRTNNVHVSMPSANVPIVLKRDSRYIINPGSVGQPRDGDPRAAYAILDTATSTWTPYRVEYPIKDTQKKMKSFHFPPRLVERLSYGR
ncbi:MAG: metallophosphatase family protein [Chloroflexi bacterium]|nr:metallophosphatase family protein [Chloroflexota bacterium]MCL5273464.1 metallophosphatase family protein [Chloroflexota bacterium]